MSKIDIVRHLTNSEGFNEQRKSARLDIPIMVQYGVIGSESGVRSPEEKKAAMTKNISPGGCLLLVAEELTENTQIELDILLGETKDEALKLKGKIVRLNRKEDGLYEYGISFIDMGKEERRLFADYCFAKMYEMIGLIEWPTDKRVKK